MITNEFSERAERAGDRYNIATGAFVAVYESMNDRMPTGSSIRAMNQELVAIAEVHAQSERELLAIDLAHAMRTAQRDASEHLGYPSSEDVDTSLSEAFSASLSYSAREIATQLQRDVSQTLRAYRTIGLKTELHRASTGMSEQASLIAVLHAGAQPRHWFHDRAGRRWPSRKFIRTVWRGAMHGLYSEVYILELARRGETDARIWHPDPVASIYGADLDLREPGEAIDEIRQALHPNTSALPRALKWFRENA